MYSKKIRNLAVKSLKEVPDEILTVQFSKLLKLSAFQTLVSNNPTIASCGNKQSIKCITCSDAYSPKSVHASH